ncbi:MAG: multicopper oxidase domain-containing protein [Okeania sp. SIO2C9]|uniref:multicopper oxidase domain-containing protein n=1 Tax=Okeania sp. SIO2C9 TaxID=2607791 RepID=UPI0013C06D91|nr:multicopper oxidase domain-containing protein [Okeania sp. SIO2C9]NEQ76739.1 multicopper oxidase domain-containing protein [Okeania sp. SIO2C9]
MANPLEPEKSLIWNRRQFLKLGLVGSGVTLAGITTQYIIPALSSSLEARAAINTIELNPTNTLREFDYGIIKQENGRQIREFQIKAINSKLQLNQAVSFISWNYNGRVPGPTLRATEGERVRIIFENEGGHAHTMHFHGIHPAEVDGVRPVRHGKTTIYEFDAQPFGVHLYHCHITPVTRHVTKGLYGMFIVDPPNSRPPADEIVLVMGGYDTNGDGKNELYAFNGLPNYYKTHPISIQQNQLVRLYLLNMIEFDPVATFHIHANFFRVYSTGMSLKPSQETDVITMGTAERHILEFSYPYPGKYMFHPHQDAIAESGCIGLFEVLSQT